jgi:hypothetical protein
MDSLRVPAEYLLLVSRLARVVQFLLIAGVVAALAETTSAQVAAGEPGAIEGVVSTQHGTVRLPGAVVSLDDASNQEVSQQVSDDQGHFKVADLPPARYRVRAFLDGFQAVDVSVTVESGQTDEVALDLPIATVTENVTVVASPVVSETGSLTAVETVNNKEAELLVPGEGVQSTLRLLSSVIQLPRGVSIDGGGPNQVGFQINTSSMVDPVTGLTRLSLPPRAIESVTVLPNPYETEFGRFSSGVVVVQSRRAPDQWRTQVDNIEPAIRLKRFTLFNVQGIGSLKPGVVTGGPIGDGSVSLEQSAQYRYDTTDIPSRPEDQLKTAQSISTFTRVDAKLSPQHSLIVTGGAFPSWVDQATLGTFTPPAATADTSGLSVQAMLTERVILGLQTFLESTLQLQGMHVEVHGQGPATMELLPEDTLGNFFNQQERDSLSEQWTETLTSSRNTRAGQHVFKAGLDVFHNAYDGTSASGTVLVARSDGSLARQLDFGAPTTQDVGSTDVAFFAQDRVQPVSRWYVEFGGRVDRDGITRTTTVSPRVGMAVILNGAGTSVLRGGYGVFAERTPSVAGAFEQFEAATDTRFAGDGVSMIGVPVQYAHVTAPDLQTASSSTWDVSYDRRLNHLLSLHLGVLDRSGSHGLIVNPVLTDRGGELLLGSTGRSDYRQAEAGVQVTHGTRLDLNASFVRSTAREDLNSLVTFYDAILAPVIGANSYAPAVADAPRRFLLRAHVMPTGSWLVLGMLDWRDGLPYSIVNDYLDFIGPRNDHRFPTYVRVEAGVERRLTIGHVHPWIGLRVSNALNAFLPADVVANVGSPAFGTFLNSEYRLCRIRLRFER